MNKKIITPYNKIPFQGFLAPLKISGNCVGRITASCNDFFALTNPAISDHFIFGLSVTIASDKASLNLSFSLLSPLFPPPAPRLI